MLLDETKICQQTAKSQECIQQEIWKIAAECFQQGLLSEANLKALLMQVTSHTPF